MGSQRLYLVHFPHEPQLRQETACLLEHRVGHQNLHAEPIVAWVEDEGEGHGNGGGDVDAQPLGRLPLRRVAELIG